MNDASKHPDKISAKSRPAGVRHNALFVIDLNSVPVKNFTAGDNSSWGISAPRRMYKVEESDDKGNISVKRANSAGPDVYTLYRFLRFYIIFLKWSGGRVVLAPLGNARGSCKRPYITERLCQAYRKSVLHKKPKRLYGEKFSSSGGQLESESASSEPRNLKQVYNARSSTSNLSRNPDKDEIFQLIIHGIFGHFVGDTKVRY